MVRHASARTQEQLADPYARDQDLRRDNGNGRADDLAFSDQGAREHLTGRQRAGYRAIVTPVHSVCTSGCAFLYRQ